MNAEIINGQSDKMTNLSFEQALFYMLPSYRKLNITFEYIYEHEIDIEKLNSALRKLVKEHDILRCKFKLNYFTPKQYPIDLNHADLSVIDSRHIQHMIPSLSLEVDHRARILALRNLASEVKFSLSEPPLFKLYAYTDCPGKTTLVLSISHIVFDASSSNVFFNDLILIYENNALIKRPAQFLELMAVKDKKLENDNYKWYQNIYRSNERTILGILPVNLRRKRNLSKNREGMILYASDELSSLIINLCKTHKVSPHIIMMAVLCILSAKLLSKDQLVLGSLFSNRISKKAETMIGCLAKLVILIVDVPSNLTCSALIKAINRRYYGSCKRLDMSFWQIIKIFTRTKSNPNSESICVSFEPNLEAYSELYKEDDNDKTFYNVVQRQVTSLDIRIGYTASGDKIMMNFLYDQSLYDRDRLDKLLESIKNICSLISYSPDKSLADIMSCM